LPGVRDEVWLKLALFGLALSSVLTPWVFRSKRGNFWVRLPIVGGVLGLLAIVARPTLRDEKPGLLDIVVGAGSAAGLYWIFGVGDRVARRYLPRGGKEIGDIYDLRRRAPSWLIAAVLAGIVAPCEELFWRGMIQDSLAKRFGRFRGAAIASICYAAVNLGSGNLTLAGASGVAGAFWGLQYALQQRVPALIVSHVIWDLWIFLVAPTPGGVSQGDECP
jgi:hypothetical protein